MELASISAHLPRTREESQQVQQLVGYSVSPSYFAVRAHLGVTVA